MTITRVFLDTPILREAFVKEVNGGSWRQDYNLPLAVLLITAQKCIAEMYGILKTSILENELASYGLVSLVHLRDAVFRGDDFLNIFWHRQTLESLRPASIEEARKDPCQERLQALTKWRAGYEQARGDFDAFVKQYAIGCVHHGVLFADHEWQAKFDDLSIETLIPSEDLEIVLAAWFAHADIFLTRDKGLIRFSFSLPLEPGIPVFCTPEEFGKKLAARQQGVVVYRDR